MQEKVSSERRRHPRLRFDLPLSVEAGHSLVLARAADIGEGGVFIKTPAAIAKGARVQMRLHLGNEAVVCEGEVRWQLRDNGGHRHGVGVQFRALSPGALSTIRRFMKEHAHEHFSVRPVETPPRPRRDSMQVDFAAALR